MFVADDGDEILVEPPTARYIVGALYPVLRPDEERDLDTEQAPTPTVGEPVTTRSRWRRSRRNPLQTTATRTPVMTKL